jgi:hypothetical protein
MFAALITLLHFSVSSRMSLANAEGDSDSGVSPNSAIRSLSLDFSNYIGASGPRI